MVESGTRRNVRTACRKCGAILPGPVDVCPICYAEQARDEEPTRNRFKLLLLAGFVTAVVILIAFILRSA